MAETRFVKGTGGGIYEVDIPSPDYRGGHRREVFDYMLAKGDLTLVDAENVEQVELSGGGYIWVERVPATADDEDERQ